MLHISKRWVWPSTLTGIDGHVMSLNGNSAPTRYGWRRWARLCVNWDMPNGKVTTYANGIHDGTANLNPDVFSGPRKDVNSKIRIPNLITDVLFGCSVTEDTAGNEIIGIRTNPKSFYFDFATLGPNGPTQLSPSQPQLRSWGH